MRRIAIVIGALAVLMSFALPLNAVVHEQVAAYCRCHADLSPPGLSGANQSAYSAHLNADGLPGNFAQPVLSNGVVVSGAGGPETGDSSAAKYPAGISVLGFRTFLKIEAPAPGTLIMSGSVAIQNVSSTTRFIDCEVRPLADPSPPRIRGTRRATHIQAFTSGTCETDAATNVDAGFHDIEFVVSGAGAGVFLLEATASVMWVPFDGRSWYESSRILPSSITSNMVTSNVVR